MTALGWSQSKISRLENGITPYNQDDLEWAADVFNCSVVDLLARKPDDPGEPIKGEEAILETLKRIEGLNQRGVEIAFATITYALDLTSPKPSPSSADDLPSPATSRREHGTST